MRYTLLEVTMCTHCCIIWQRLEKQKLYFFINDGKGSTKVQSWFKSRQLQQ
jgi:hypothetical protein